MHFLDCIRPASSRAVTIGTGVKVRLEDRLKHQLGSGLYHTVPYRRNPERPLSVASWLRDPPPSHRCWWIRLVDQVRPDSRQPLLEPLRFDHPERRPIHSWRALVGARQIIGVAENVLAIDLV